MESTDRVRIITGNWKMYKTTAEAIAFVKDLVSMLQETTLQVFLAIPFTAIQSVSKELASTSIVIGAQNMSDASEGAFTGEIAGRMLKEAGAKFVLLGHSERRRFFHEDNAFINRKVQRAVKEGLRPVLCIGESLEERESGRTHEVLRKQLTECLYGIPPELLKDLIIAYEPIWAIGSLESATPEMAQEAHHDCRNCLAEILSPEIAAQLVIQYGGSVRPANAAEFLMQPDVDGLLIGGASLSLESFVKIVNDCSYEMKPNT